MILYSELYDISPYGEINDEGDDHDQNKYNQADDEGWTTVHARA